jgi:hypothetical protein
MKETNLVDLTGASIMAPVVRRSTAALQDVARLTTRNTVEQYDTVANPAPVREAGVVYDPDVWRPDVTLKQVLTEDGHDGVADGSVGLGGTDMRGGAYATTEYDAKRTQKQSLADAGILSYGPAQAVVVQAPGGYTVTKDGTEPTPTERQWTGHVEYFGGTGSSFVAKQTSHEEYDNATIDTSREIIAQGRAPTAEAAKVAAGVVQMGAFDGTTLRSTLAELKDTTTGGGVGRVVPLMPVTGAEEVEALGEATHDRNRYASGQTDRFVDQLIAIQTQRHTNAVAQPAFSEQCR